MTAVSHSPQQQIHSREPPSGPGSSSTNYGQHQQQQQYMYQNHSVMEDMSDEESEEDEEFDNEIDPEQQRFYEQQQRQSMYYQQHQQQNGGLPVLGQPGQGGSGGTGSKSRGGAGKGDDADDEDMYSDDESSAASIPDENIDAGLTYALHTFLATVEGQASVVKGDSLLLLDDTNAYWWLVRVLKTEDVGYIPAENIETPYERLARLNKHRNVDLAHPTELEKVDGEAQGRERMKAGLSAKKKSAQADRSDSGGSDEPRRVIFAPPTYVEPSIRTWSSDEEGESGEEDEEGDDEDEDMEGDEGEGVEERRVEEKPMSQQQANAAEMEPDDGMEWADGAGREDQRRAMEKKQAQQAPAQVVATASPVQAKSNNPFAPRLEPVVQPEVRNGLDPAQATGETRRITVTPALAQSGPSSNVLLPSAVMANGQRNVSGQSTTSATSTYSATGSATSEPASPSEDKKVRKMRKSGSQDSLSGSERGDKKEKKRSMLGGLFSRKGKDKKGISSSDPRVSEDSIVSGAQDGSPSSLNRKSEESVVTVRAPTPADRPFQQQQSRPGDSPQGGPHSLRLQQQDQATMQAYSSKYLKLSPVSDIRTPTASEAATAVAQSAAAMRLSATMNGATKRPSSIIVSPNPAAPLLNVMRVFAGDHVKSDASFKTVLLNETTTSSDLIRQAMQRFRMHLSAQSSSDNGFFLTVKDVNGDEMELEADEKPLSIFLDTVQRCTEDDGSLLARAITPTVKRSSISSISSMMSLSSHPAIAKLGMNDFSDDSIVKIYLNRRRPGSVQLGGKGAHETSSELGSYSSQLSTVLESSPEPNRRSGVWSNDDSHSGTPPHSMRYNPSLTINTKGESSPERFSSPSARVTVQLLLHPPDLPDGFVFDPVNDAVITRQVLRDRLVAGHPSQGSRDLPQDKRKRLFMLPRNATVVEAIEQGLERFGIQGGVVDGGDDVEGRGGKRSGTKFRYSLVAISKGKERELAPSSKLLESYTTPPTLKPVERTTPEQRRRSREWSYNVGTPSDILPTDPIFILRRSGDRHPPPRSSSTADTSRAVLQQQQQQSLGIEAPPFTAPAALRADSRNGAKSPQEIIAAQRAASRATQKALISAHANKSEGIDVVLQNKGTLRSSRLLEPTGDEVVRYSFIDHDGETYDISELLEEEWGHDGAQSSPHVGQGGLSANSLRPPAPYRRETDQSVYVTAPSTPEPGVSREVSQPIPSHERKGSGSTDILRGVFERSAGKPEGKLEEKIARVIDKVKSGKAPTSRGVSPAPAPLSTTTTQPSSGGRTTPSSGAGPAPIRPASRAITPSLQGQSGSPASTASRSNSRQGGPAPYPSQSTYQNTAATVNRIISKHRQQPSIASIMSDLSGPTTHDQNEEHDEHDRDGNTTPATATSSSHPTPPLGTSIFLRAVSSTSPTPRHPVRYTDDFGMKTLMGLVEARAREMRPKSRAAPGNSKRAWSQDSGHSTRKDGVETDEAIRVLWGEKMGREEMEGMNMDIKACLGKVQSRLDAWDAEVDEILAALGGRDK